MPQDNPKLIRAMKEGKAPLEYLVDSVMDGDAWVHKGGADKYGVRNWLIDHIKASTYIGAIRRHLKAWSEGEDLDSDSGYSHLYHIRACCAIVLDAEKHDTLIDDRQRCESINDAQTAPIDISDAVMFPNFGINFKPLCASSAEEDPYYIVLFYVAHGAVTFKGLFPDKFTAEEYARLNPQNIAGMKTVHALNRP